MAIPILDFDPSSPNGDCMGANSNGTRGSTLRWLWTVPLDYIRGLRSKVRGIAGRVARAFRRASSELPWSVEETAPHTVGPYVVVYG